MQPEVDSDDDEEEAWSKWEAANHERYEAKKLMREWRAQREAKKEAAVRTEDYKRSTPATGPRGHRAASDPIYANLLDRRDQNAAKVNRARARNEMIEDAEHFLSPTKAQAQVEYHYHSHGAVDYGHRGYSSDDAGGHRHAGRAGARGREGNGGSPGVGLVRNILGRQLLESREYLAGHPHSASPNRRRRPRARSLSPPNHLRGMNPHIPQEVAFGRHYTREAEMARLRAELQGRNASEQKVSTGSRFNPPRLYTSERQKQREENQRALRRAWRRKELTEKVVHRAVGHVPGEPGMQRHWDDPMRAAAEQAAVKMMQETGMVGGEAAARAAARRAAAAAAALVRNGFTGSSSAARSGEYASDYHHSEEDDDADFDLSDDDSGEFPGPQHDRSPLQARSPGIWDDHGHKGNFLRAGQGGGAGISRGHSVAAHEEEADPDLAARLRQSLASSIGPAAMGLVRAEKERKSCKDSTALGVQRSLFPAGKQSSGRGKEGNIEGNEGAVRRALGAQLAETRRFLGGRRNDSGPKGMLEARPASARASPARTAAQRSMSGRPSRPRPSSAHGWNSSTIPEFGGAGGFSTDEPYSSDERVAYSPLVRTGGGFMTLQDYERHRRDRAAIEEAAAAEIKARAVEKKTKRKPSARGKTVAGATKQRASSAMHATQTAKSDRYNMYGSGKTSGGSGRILRTRPASAGIRGSGTRARTRSEASAAIPILDPRARYLKSQCSPHRSYGNWFGDRSPYRNDNQSSHDARGNSEHAERQLLVKTYGRPRPGTLGFSRPQEQHGLQLIRESLGSWANHRDGARGGMEDQRLRESYDRYAQSKDVLHGELAAMAVELSEERSVWSSHSRA